MTSGNKTSFKHLLTIRQYLFVAGVFAAVLAVLIYTFYSGNHYNKPGPIKITISPGEKFPAISEKLYKAGIIPSRFHFKLAAQLMAAPQRIQPGRYSIQNDLSYMELVEYLINGKADRIKQVLIFDGTGFRKMSERLQQEGIIEKDSFFRYASSRVLAKNFNIKQPNLLGYLLPGKYLLFEHSSPAEIVDTLFNNFQRFMHDSLLKAVEHTGYSLNQILTMASIIDWETNRNDEMPRIAGVYFNRLKIGMKLQADPTIQFIRSDGWGRVKGDILQINSPYNTYRNYGLPPAPINNPGKAAIIAAIYPEEHKYLFFAANPGGYHEFSRTFAEHKMRARNYHKWLDKQGSKK